MQSKYANDYEEIKNQQNEPGDDAAADERFDLDAALSETFISRLKGRLANFAIERLLLPFSRRFRPVWRIFGFVWVTRSDDVEAVLNDAQAFNVPFGLEMAELAGGTNFALGDDGELHRRQRASMEEVWNRCDALSVSAVRSSARYAAEALIADSGGEIDAVSDFITRVATEVCLEAYGLETESPDDFAEYCMAAAALLFADPWGDPKIRKAALVGAGRLRTVLDSNYDRARRARRPGGNPGPLRGALQILMQMADEPDGIGPAGADEQAVKDEIRAILFGLITGFVPTNTLAAGNILAELAARPGQFSAAVALARESAELRLQVETPGGTQSADLEERYQEKAEALERLLFEAARFRPALFPGQFRVRSDAAATGSAGSQRLAAVAAGATVMASTASALMDRCRYSRPRRFDPERFVGRRTPRSLMFGLGSHDCIGEQLARTLITEIFLVLLSQPGIRFARKWPRMRHSGPFPRHMEMRFDPDQGHRRQSMITSAVPLAQGQDPEEVREYLRDLGQPLRPAMTAEQQSAGEAVESALSATNIVHFASINVVDLGEPDSPRHFLLFEFNVDGPPEPALEKIFRKAGRYLEPLADYVDRGRNAGDVGSIVRERMIKFHSWPWGPIGLNFPGTGDFSVAQIEAEHELSNEISGWLKIQRGSRTDESLIAEARRRVRRNSRLQRLLIRPSKRLPAFTRWTDISFGAFIGRYFTSTSALILYAIFVGATVLVPVGLWLWFSVALLPAYVTTWMAPILAGLTAAIVLIGILRFKETIVDKPDDRSPDHLHMRALLRTEDLPGYAQNHLTSVSQLKRGPFRKLTMALALYAIKQMSLIWFRPGFVTDFATIHYAKWFRVPGTQKLIFQTNYDGSWESYLEDFITKVHGGQTAAWNNGVGFPRTNWFFLDGARDGDRFKRWVRRQQVETLFWYSRFPDLTTEDIRNNALVRDGLARARTVSEYRAWASLFGSAPKPKDSIESDLVQSLLFGGLGRHRHARCLGITFQDRQKARRWIHKLVETSANAENPPTGGKTSALCFGDSEPGFGAKFVALSAEGLCFLGLSENSKADGMATFPISFADGMASRAAILGDGNPVNDPAKWRWSDSGIGGTNTSACHVVLLLYDVEKGEKVAGGKAVGLAGQIQEFEADCREFALKKCTEIDIGAHGRRIDVEPFGFRDGISQPVMRGTRRFGRGDALPDDIVGPGEFILGYRDSRGFYPPSPTVSSGDDPHLDLPPTESAIPGRIPAFDNPALIDQRDFGRNGSFLIIRQLRQDKEKFKAYVEQEATQLRADNYLPRNGQSRRALPRPPIDLHGSEKIDDSIRVSKTDLMFSEELVAAKLIGRWRDGSSLARYPVASRSQIDRGAFVRELERRVWLFLDGSRKDRRLINEIFSEDNQADATFSEDGWDRFSEQLEEIRTLYPDLELPLELLSGVKPDNDFRHGTADPQGMNCPLSAHIRKANPRDSFRPGDPLQLEINNRHRLLRRGRTYRIGNRRRPRAEDDAASEHESGTLFMCFNANIERQFEFVQQTWLNARSFHGMRNAPDPLTSVKSERDAFVIPSSTANHKLPLYSGMKDKQEMGMADFVQMVGGGYFFMPSLQALRFLSRPRQ